MRKKIIGLVGVLAVSCAIGVICRLGIWGSLVICVITLLMTRTIIRFERINRLEYQRFQQVEVYLEQLEQAFLIRRRIYPALKDVAEVFPDCEMQSRIEEALKVFEENKENSHISESALTVIEQEYGCEQMTFTHHFLIQNELQGGSCEEAIKIIEDRRKLWTDEVEHCRLEKKNLYVSGIMAIVLMVVISEMLVLMMPEQLSIATHTVARTAFCVEYLLCALLVVKLAKRRCTYWLEPVIEREESAIAKDYQVLEQKKYSELDAYIRRKRLKKELLRDFPDWMFQVIMYLETDSVQGAILRTIADAPNVMKYPLQKMKAELEKNPASGEPYFHFLGDYDVPKIHEAMKLLYAISAGTGGSVEAQLYQVIKKNNDMTMQSERMKKDNLLAGMMGYLYYPVFPAGIKIMLDLALVLTQLYGEIGQML